jgi:hypothetical protein
MLVSVLVVLSLGSCGLLGLQLYVSSQALRHAERTSLLAASDRSIYRATQSLRVDRGVAMLSLLAEDSPTATITKALANTDARMETVFREVTADQAEGTAANLATLRTAWSNATAQRDILLKAGAKPRVERRLPEVQTWFTAVTTAITSLSDLSGRIAGEARITDPIVGEYVLARQYAWAIRNSLGEECGWARLVFTGTTAMTPQANRVKKYVTNP